MGVRSRVFHPPFSTVPLRTSEISSRGIQNEPGRSAGKKREKKETDRENDGRRRDGVKTFAPRGAEEIQRNLKPAAIRYSNYVY